MLKTRTLTAIVLLLFVMAMILLLNSFFFHILTAAVLLWAAWEWSGLSGCFTAKTRTAFVGATLLCMILFMFLPLYLLLVISLCWIWGFTAVYRFGKHRSALGFESTSTRQFMGVITLATCWLAINLFDDIPDLMAPRGWLLFGLALIWATDIGAFFTGTWFGKHRLIERVSPKKSWEGFWGGLALAFLVSIIGGFVFFTHWASFFGLVSVCLITALFAVGGDLFESLLKRLSDVKDSGTALPGHGGILDRIDSVIAAMPVFALGTLILNQVI